MAIIDDQPTPASSGPVRRIERTTSRVRVVGWALALGWLLLLVALVTLGHRESSIAHLEDGLRAGEIIEVEVVGELIPDGGLGYQGVELRWRDGLVVRTATLTHATNERMARDARRDGSTEPVIVGSLEDHLTALDPDLRVVLQGDRHGQTYTALGYQGPGWLGLLHLVLLVATLGLIAGPRPWRATRWAWAWLVLLAPAFGVPAYLLLGGPTGLFRPGHPGRVWLTGGWAFLLALLLGGTPSS